MTGRLPWCFLPVAALTLVAACKADLPCNNARCGGITPVDEAAPETPGQDDGEAPCADAAACNDGMACNGAERCVDGQCSAGAALECPLETSCQERAAEPSCAYEAPSPWLVYVGDDLKLLDVEDPEAANAAELQLFGAPEHLLGMMSPIPLTKEAVRPGEWGIDQFKWAPDGSFMVFVCAQDLDWVVPNTPKRVHWLRFGAGIPARAQPVEGHPERSNLRLQDIALDSSALLTSGPEQLFLTRFDGERASTSIAFEFPASDWLQEAKFCHDGRHAFVQLSLGDEGRDESKLVALDGSAEPRSLGDHGSPTLSPDRKFVSIAREADVSISACSTLAEPIRIPRVSVGPSSIEWVSWSYDSRFFAYIEAGEAAEGPAESRAVIASHDGRVLWSKPGSKTLGWSPGAPTLVVIGEGKVSSWLAVHIEDNRAVEREHALDQPLELGSPTWVRAQQLTFETWEGENNAIKHLWLADLERDGRLLAVPTPSDGFGASLLDPTTGLFVYGQEGEVFALDIRAQAPKPQRLASMPGYTLSPSSFSPDGRHLLVGGSTVRDREYSELWRFPLVPEGEEPVRLSNGSIYDVGEHAFQPAR